MPHSLILTSQLDPEAIAQRLSRMVERIEAHECDDIDPIQVYKALRKALSQYPLYVKAIQTYLDTLEED